MQELFKQGVQVIPFLTREEVKKFEQDLVEEVKQSPEYEDPSKAYREGFLMGGCQFMGNPSSFHLKTVRKLRLKAHELIYKKLYEETAKAMPEYADYLFAQLVDRLKMSDQNKLHLPGKESWHRDESKKAVDTDVIFGGWVNLNHDMTQKFSCIRKTHKVINSNTGFALLTKDEQKAMDKHPDKTSVQIPPGHIMIFFEKLLHEVIRSKMPKHVHRLFLGWHLTKSDVCLDGDNEKLKDKFKNFEAMDIKSGQHPTMFSGNHLSYPKLTDKLVEFSKNIKPEYRVKYTFKSGQRQGKTIDIVKRTMSPIKCKGWRLAHKYEAAELDIFIPHGKRKRTDREQVSGAKKSRGELVDLSKL